MAVCTHLLQDDGGLILTGAIDVALTLIIFAGMWLFWELWIEKKQKEAEDIEVRDVEKAYSSSSDSTDEIEKQPEEANQQPGLEKADRQPGLEKLIWYKFPFQIWSIKDETLEQRHGNDGLIYIHFSRSLQAFSVTMCLLCAGILMPLYFFLGEKQSTTFGQLTILNLEPDSDWLWVPTLIAPAILIIAVLIMENFKKVLVIDSPSEVDHAVIIQGTMLDKEQLTAYLQKLGLDEHVVDIQYVYDVELAYDLNSGRKAAARMELRYRDLRDGGQEVQSVSYGGCLCCLTIEEPAVQYWEQEKLELSRRFQEELLLCKRVPKVFIVWKRTVDTQRMINMHKPTEWYKLAQEQTTTSVDWNISKAPVHYDINWENYAMSNAKWWTRAILINIVVLILVVFFTTPIIIIQFLWWLIFVDSDDDSDLVSTGSSSDFWAEYATILVLLIIEAVLPQLVNLSCSLERHRTKTNRNSWCIYKVFIYLLISELFMPAFGYTSLAGLLEGYFSTDDLLSNWSCVFSSYRTAFMCKIVMSAALIGRAIELFNPWGFAAYCYWYWEHETQREYKQIFKKMRDRFNIGYNYAKLVAYSAIFISFGVICPLITLIGLAFVLIKYSVDKYLMLYFHRPCGSYGVSSHMAATTYLVFSCCLLQIFMFIFDAIYIGMSSFKTYVALCMVVFITAIYFYDLWTSFVAWLFPERAYADIYEKPGQERGLVGVYTSPYLRKIRDYSEIPPSTERGGIRASNGNYGSVDPA